MKLTKTKVGGVLAIIALLATIVANGFFEFIIVLLQGIFSSTSKDNSQPLIVLLLVFLAVAIIIGLAIASIVLTIIMMARTKNVEKYKKSNKLVITNITMASVALISSLVIAVLQFKQILLVVGYSIVIALAVLGIALMIVDFIKVKKQATSVNEKAINIIDVNKLDV